MKSPYPWHYTLRWPFYYLWPSMRNRSGIKRVPDQHYFSREHAETLRLMFCGDIMVQNYDAIPILHRELCDVIRSADFFIGNCEAPVANHAPNPHTKYGFTFNMPRSYLENIIQQTGLPAKRWILSTANNHTGDKGYSAFLQTHNILKNIGVQTVGCYKNDTLPLKIISAKGLRIGFLAWTEWLNNEIFNSEEGVVRREHIIHYDWQMIKKNLNLDYLIGLPHWEYEFQHHPHVQSRVLAKTLIDEKGIDFLIGSHTHTLQSMDWFQHGICAYNLGNFCGFGKALSVKLIPLLEIQLNLNKAEKNKLLSYRLHYFFQQNIDQQVHIIPLHLTPMTIQKRLKNIINKLYISEMSNE